MTRKNNPPKDEIFAASSPLSESDENLEKLFDKIESDSLETLENASRQIITLASALLGAFFGLLAFKDIPAYLAFLEIQIVGALALTAFFGSLFCALQGISPNSYEFVRSSLTAKRKTLNEMLVRKRRSVLWATRFFGIGSFFMLVAAVDILLFRI